MLKLIDSPVSRRGRSSLDAGRGSTPYSKVATSPARASTISTTKIGSNDVSNTVHTDVRPMSVIFRRALVRTHFRTRSSRRGHRVSCRDHIFFISITRVRHATGFHCARPRTGGSSTRKTRDQTGKSRNDDGDDDFETTSRASMSCRDGAPCELSRERSRECHVTALFTSTARGPGGRWGQKEGREEKSEE